MVPSPREGTRGTEGAPAEAPAPPRRGDGIARRLGTLKYDTDKAYEHITVNPEVCGACPHSLCTIACPAQCFTRVGGRLVYRYEDCLECGTCDIICERGSVKWTWPRGPFGVRFAYG